jgi:hypothetical protein
MAILINRQNKIFKRRSFYLSFLLLLLFIATAGTDKSNLLKIIDHRNDFAADHFGNIYLITFSGVEKLDKDFLQTRSYSGGNSGQISSLDVSNPLEIFLFQKENNSIVVLDNALSEINRFDLSKAGFYDISLACRAQDNAAWIFDAADQKIKKISSEGGILHSSGHLTRYLQNKIEPVQISANDKHVFLLNPAEGIMIFDRYGSFFRTINSEGTVFFQVLDEQQLLCFRNGKAWIINFQTAEEKELTLPEGLKNPGKAIIAYKRLLVSDEEGLKIYNY